MGRETNGLTVEEIIQQLEAAEVPERPNAEADELAWLQTYRALAAAHDSELPASGVETRFAEIMLTEIKRGPITFAAAPTQRACAELTAPQAAAPQLSAPPIREQRRERVWPWVVATSWVIALGGVLVAITPRPTATPHGSVPPTPPAATAPTTLRNPALTASPADVITDMRTLTNSVWPGKQWFDEEGTLLRCPLDVPGGGHYIRKYARFSVGNFDEIQTEDTEAAQRDFEAISRQNEYIAEKMIEIWLDNPMQPQLKERYSVEKLHGNWYFGEIYPGLKQGSITFDNGVGVLMLETQCL